MALPKEKDLKKRESKIDSLRNSIGEGGKLTDKQMCGIIRTSVRKSWMRSPVKLLKLELAKTPDYDDSNRRTWKIECEQCKDWFKLADVEVDHIKGEHKFTSLDDIESFARSILEVSLDELQVFCKPCHQIKTYAERNNISFEEAAVEKKVIAYFKYNKVDRVKRDLLEYGYSEKEVSNATKRKALVRQLMKERKFE